MCDKIAAGMVYRCKEWTQVEPLEYWNKNERDNVIVKHPGSVEFMDTVLSKLAKEGIKSTLSSKYLKRVYKEISLKYNKSLK